MKNTFTLLLFICLYTISINIQAQIPTDYLAYYGFENNVEDASANNLHGTEHGTTIGYVVGKEGQAIEFNNVNHGAFDVNDYVSFPAISVESFTVSFWAKYRNSSYSSQNGHSVLFSYGNTRLDTALNLLHQKTTSELRAEIVSEFDDGNLTYNSTSFNSIQTNEWEHITAVFGPGSLKLYLNGVFVEEKILNFNPKFIEKEFFIAYHEWHESPFNASRYNGLIDELYVYDRVLTDSEITSIFNNDMATALNFNQNIGQVTAYPNPTRDFVRLSLDISEIGKLERIQIVNIYGQVQALEYSQQNSELIFDVRNLAEGIYFIELSVSGSYYKSTVIKH